MIGIPPRRKNGSNHGEAIEVMGDKLDLPIAACLFLANDEMLRRLVMGWPFISRGARNALYHEFMGHYYKALEKGAPQT